MISGALPSTDLLAFAAPASPAPVKEDSKPVTMPAGQAEPLPNQFSTLVAEYSSETLAGGVKVDDEMDLKQPGDAAPVTAKPVQKAKPEGRTFSGTWQLLLDMLDSGFNAWLPVAQGTTGPLNDTAQKVAEELTSADTSLAQVKTPQQAVPQRVNVSQAASVLDQVASAIISAAGGSNRLVVRLHPPELGTVTVKVTRVDGKVSVVVETSDNSVQSILARGASELRDNLKAQGVSVDRFDVTNGESHGEKDGRDGKRRRSTVVFQIEFASPKGE